MSFEMKNDCVDSRFMNTDCLVLRFICNVAHQPYNASASEKVITSMTCKSSDKMLTIAMNETLSYARAYDM